MKPHLARQLTRRLSCVCVSACKSFHQSPTLPAFICLSLLHLATLSPSGFCSPLTSLFTRCLLIPIRSISSELSFWKVLRKGEYPVKSELNSSSGSLFFHPDSFSQDPFFSCRLPHFALLPFPPSLHFSLCSARTSWSICSMSIKPNREGGSGVLQVSQAELWLKKRDGRLAAFISTLKVQMLCPLAALRCKSRTSSPTLISHFLKLQKPEEPPNPQFPSCHFGHPDDISGLRQYRRWKMSSYLSAVRDIRPVYLLSDSPPSTYVNTMAIYLFALNWPLKFSGSAAHKSLTVNDAVKFCVDVYSPQTRAEFSDPVTLALRSQFLFAFNVLTRVGRIAVKLGEDVQSRCWEDLCWRKGFSGFIVKCSTFVYQLQLFVPHGCRIQPFSTCKMG